MFLNRDQYHLQTKLRNKKLTFINTLAYEKIQASMENTNMYGAGLI